MINFTKKIKKMTTERRNLSINSSAGSSQCDNEHMDSINTRSYVKNLLRSRIFLGRYLERRFSNERIGYRDVVLVSAAEVEFKRDLMEAEHKLRALCPNFHWIGITDAEFLGSASEVCLWTEIDNQPLGPFWFQVKSIKFREYDEVIVTVKCLRHISESFLELEPILTGVLKKTKEKSDAKLESSVESLNETCTEIVDNLKSSLTITNVKEFAIFVCAFVIAMFTGTTAFVNFLGNFILALIRELSLLTKNSTPLFLGFLEFLSKIIGGFYILIAMFFRPSNNVSINKRSIEYNRKPQNEKIYNDYRDFD